MIPFIASFVIWALLHSITAAQPFKNGVRRRLGGAVYTGTYRFLYNLFAVLTFLPVLFFLAVGLPETVLWQVSSPTAWIFIGVQGLGLLGLLASLWQTDIWAFAGLRQFTNWLVGSSDAVPPAKLVTNGTYRLVRHPLYFFSLLFIWFSPKMTLNTLIFNFLVTLYFWIGSRYEEKRLAAEFGKAYETYVKQTPGLIPINLSRWTGRRQMADLDR